MTFLHFSGLRDWLKITDDPQVNFAVDCVLAAIDCVLADEGEELIYDEQLYAAEVKAFRDRGPFA
jgi:hypothetical protein